MTNDAELGLRDRLAKLSGVKLLRGTRLSAELERLQRQLERLKDDTSDEEIWQRVELARHQERPYTLDYVERILEDFFELHGDRGRMDDHAIVTGIGKLEGRTIALIGHQKGRDLKERTNRNFGMAYPEGYRKAMRVMELADRHGFPLPHAHRHPRRLPGRRGRAARPGRRHRPLAGRDGAARRATVAGRDRRGRLGRRPRARGRRPGAHAGERDLLGDLARGLRGTCSRTTATRPRDLVPDPRLHDEASPGQELKQAPSHMPDGHSSRAPFPASTRRPRTGIVDYALIDSRSSGP